MKTKLRTGIAVILIGLLPHFMSAGNISKKNENVRLGISRVNITPLKPAMMSGYANRETPSEGVHDSIYASAFYFLGEDTESLLIIADIIGFSFGFTDELRSSISAKTGIIEQNILLVAAHNHGGPSIGNYEPVKEYTAELKNKLINLAADALTNPVPVRMGAGKGYCSLNINRRAEFSKGEVWLGRNQDAPCDHELSVIKFENMEQKTLAVLINWPCHGTVTGDSNYQITGDWLGAAAGYIRARMGEDVVVGVTAGASGDINPIYGPGNVFSEVEAVGYHVGDEALKVIGQMVTYPVTTLQSTETMLTFPGKKGSPNHFPQNSYEPGPDTQIRISALKIGSVVLAGISGEVFNEIGMEIKKQSPFSQTVILTHCNGSSGYICTDSSFPKGGYEVKVTKLMPGAEKPLIRKYIDLIQSFEY